MTYIFTLRRGVKFNDDPVFPGGTGRELTIDDVIYSIKRFADTNVNVKSYILIQGSVVGLDEFRAKTKELGKDVDYAALDIEGIQALDPLRFTIRFAGDNPLALYPFAASSMSIVAREVVEKYGDELDRHPVGTGPFRISKYDSPVRGLTANHEGLPRRGSPILWTIFRRASSLLTATPVCELETNRRPVRWWRPAFGNRARTPEPISRPPRAPETVSFRPT